MSIYEAIQAGDTDLAVRVMAQPDFNLEKQGPLALSYAAHDRNWEIVKLLLEASRGRNWGAAPYNVPLHRAVLAGKMEIARLAIAAGADVNLPAADPEEPTLLMVATGTNNLEMVKLLVEAGANANTVRGDRCALSIAAEMGNGDLFEYLTPLTEAKLCRQARRILRKTMADRRKREDKLTENFIDAAAEGNISALHQALDKGVDVNAIGSEHYTALWVAAYWGRAKAARILIEAGAKIDLPDLEQGWSPLMAAVGMSPIADRDDVVDVLIEAGANVNTTTRSGQTPLIKAAECGYLNMVECLLAAGADANLRDKADKTALDYAREALHRWYPKADYPGTVRRLEAATKE